MKLFPITWIFDTAKIKGSDVEKERKKEKTTTTKKKHRFEKDTQTNITDTFGSNTFLGSHVHTVYHFTITSPRETIVAMVTKLLQPYE